jgi:outer membrane protein assembly factor BamB
MKHLAAGLLACLLASAVRADDWPCWRGPHHTGISEETGWLDRWPANGPPITWKASVGVGYSCVTVADGRAFTMGHRDGKDTVYCLNAVTGEVIWRHSYDAELGDLYFDGGPTSTPTYHDGSLYALSRWGDLFCFEAASGKVRWSRNLARENNVRVPTWGFAGAPVVHDRLLLLTAGKAGLALAKDTGEVVWASEVDEEAGYATPVPFRRGGDWSALFSSGKAYTAVDVKTGRELWSHRWITRYGVNAADPVLAGDRVFLSSGYDKGAALLAVGEGGPREVWRNKKMRNQCNPCVLLDGHLYGIDGDATQAATLRCLELKTGEVRWTEEGIGFGALTAAAGKLIVLSESGELLVAPASPRGFKPSARAGVLDGKCWTAPVLANGRIYCRAASGRLVCVDVRGRNPVPKAKGEEK